MQEAEIFLYRDIHLCVLVVLLHFNGKTAHANRKFKILILPMQATPKNIQVLVLQKQQHLLFIYIFLHSKRAEHKSN